MVKVGDLYKQGGSNWRVVDITAGIITLRKGNGVTRIIHPSGLAEYRRADVDLNKVRGGKRR